MTAVPELPTALTAGAGGSELNEIALQRTGEP